MSNKLIQLKDKDSNLLYPSIITNSIPDKGVTLAKLAQALQDKINSAATDANISDLTNNVNTNATNIAKLTNYAYANDCVAFDGIISTAITEESVGLSTLLDSSVDTILWSSTLKHFVLKHVVSGTVSSAKYYNTWSDASSSENGNRPSDFFQTNGTPSATKLYFDQKNNVVYRYDSTNKTLIAIADKGALDNLTSKVSTLSSLNSEIAVDKLDSLTGNDIYKSGNPISYSVILSSNKAKVGVTGKFSCNIFRKNNIWHVSAI